MGSSKPWGMGGYGLEEGRDTLLGLRPGSSLAVGMGDRAQAKGASEGLRVAGAFHSLSWNSMELWRL